MIDMNLNDMVVKLLESNVKIIAKAIREGGTVAYKQMLIKTNQAFSNYLKAGIKKYQNTKTILYRDKSVYLYDFYVSMDLEQGERIYTTDNINNILAEDNFITILGTGGIGKSTLLKHFYLNSIINTDRIPIFVELRALNKSSNLSLKDCIYETMINLKFDLEKKYFEQTFKSGRYIILFDGYDEVYEDRRNMLNKEIVSLNDNYDKNYYILSSRKTSAIFDGWNNSTSFELLPLSLEKASSLIKILDYEQDVKDRFLLELKSSLYSTHTSFCSNPLLLTIMLLSYEEFAEIPVKLNLFYGRAFEILYSRHDGSKGFKRKHKTDRILDSDGFEKVFSLFCTLSYLDEVYMFSFSDLKTYVNKSKKLTQFNFESKDFIDDLIESVCILYLDGLNYGFQHRSFQEYFTAIYLLSVPDDNLYNITSKMLIEKSLSINTDSVLKLMFEINEERMEKVFLIPKLEQFFDLICNNEVSKKHLNYLRMFISACILEVNGVEEEEEEVASIYFSYITSKNRHYHELVNFVYDRYNNLPNLNLKKFSTTSETSLIKRYGLKSKNAISLRKTDPSLIYQLKLSDIKDNKELLENINLHSYAYLEHLNVVEEVLKSLREKHVESKNVMEEIFGIKI